ncbi:MAG: macro domain-containing protein [Bacteroidales bacterium]|nr:macro domain-containing protein [Bacteroidales bacterium]
MKNAIKYQIGDATEPTGKGIKIIVHICNDIGAWGKGFVMALSGKWSKPETEYRKWFKDGKGFELGAVQFVQVENDLFVANIIGQRGIISIDSRPPIRYEAVETGLAKVAEKAIELGASIHMPRIGSGLAGGKWEEIEKIINNTLVNRGLSVTVYDLE